MPDATGTEVRRAAARGELGGSTAGLALGYVQANLVVVPRDLAFDFLLFCQRNPKPCPLLDVTEAGSPEPKLVAPAADLRTDLPRYRVYKNGELVDDPAAIGIKDIGKPDFGDAVEVRRGEVPVFWACGVTPQAVAMQVRPPLLITHKPGHMFVTDLRDTDLEGE